MKAPKTIGTFRSARSGQFAESGPDSDPELKADVLKLIEAIDLFSPVLDWLLLGLVRDKKRDQSVMFAQTLQVLGVLRDTVTAELLAVGISAPSPPVLESDRIKAEAPDRKTVARSRGARP